MDAPLDAADLPPLGAAYDALRHLLVAERGDEVRGSLIAEPRVKPVRRMTVMTIAGQGN